MFFPSIGIWRTFSPVKADSVSARILLLSPGPVPLRRSMAKGLGDFLAWWWQREWSASSSTCFICWISRKRSLPELNKSSLPEASSKMRRLGFHITGDKNRSVFPWESPVFSPNQEAAPMRRSMDQLPSSLYLHKLYRECYSCISLWGRFSGDRDSGMALRNSWPPDSPAELRNASSSKSSSKDRNLPFRFPRNIPSE